MGLALSNQVAAGPIIVDSATLTVMTYNVRYDTGHDGKNRWDNRKQHVAGLINMYYPDVVGIQEALINQVEYLAENLPEYDWYGLGRDDGKKEGEFSAVFYKKSTLKKVSEKTMWLSETPDVPSTGWDAALPRIATLLRFEHLETNRDFYFVNTHFDHQGDTARHQSAVQIITRIQTFQKGLPVVLVGDFNIEDDESPYSVLTTEFGDAFKKSQYPHYGPEGTFSGFKLKETIEKRIDYIFISYQIKCIKYATITDFSSLGFHSDHLPVFAELRLK